MLAAEQLARCRLGADRLEEGLGDCAVQEAVTVLGEGGGVPDRLVHGQADEPAQQEVVAQLLAEPALGGDGVEDLGKLGAQQVLGGDRGTAALGVEGIESRLDRTKGGIDQSADGTRGVVVRHDVLEERGQHDEPGLPLFVAAHRCPPPARLPCTVAGSPGREGHPPEGSR